jgi:hypothetical protein
MNSTVEQLAIRVSAEFREMPDLKLTMSQAQRLWGVDSDALAEVVALLVARSVLRRQADTISRGRPTPAEQQVTATASRSVAP